MNKKSLWIAAGILAAFALLAWRWLDRPSSEADAADHSESGAVSD